MNFLPVFQLLSRNDALCKQFPEHRTRDAVAQNLVKFWPRDTFTSYSIAAVTIISDTIISRARQRCSGYCSINSAMKEQN